MKKKIKAVTLIELIMVIVVVGVLTAGLSFGVREVVNLWNFLVFRDEIVSQGRIALMRMGREIRQICSREAFEPIQAAEAARFRFDIMDLDGDGNDDTVEFYHNAGNNELRRIFNDNPAAGNILATNVSSLNFTYYDQNNSPTTVPSSVYRIVISLALSSGSNILTLRSQIYPRNF